MPTSPTPHRRTLGRVDNPNRIEVWLVDFSVAHRIGTLPSVVTQMRGITPRLPSPGDWFLFGANINGSDVELWRMDLVDNVSTRQPTSSPIQTGSPSSPPIISTLSPQSTSSPSTTATFTLPTASTTPRSTSPTTRTATETPFSPSGSAKGYLKAKIRLVLPILAMVW